MTYNAKTVGQAMRRAGQRRKRLEQLFKQAFPLAEKCNTDREKSVLLDVLIAEAKVVMKKEGK